MEGTVHRAVEQQRDGPQIVDVPRGHRLHVHVLAITPQLNKHLEQVLHHLAARHRAQLHRLVDAAAEEGGRGLQEVVDVVVGRGFEGAENQTGGGHHVHIALEKVVPVSEGRGGGSHAGILVGVVEGVEVRSGGNGEARAMQITIAQVVDVLVTRRDSRCKDPPQAEFLQDGRQTVLHRHIRRIVVRIAVGFRGDQIGGVELLVGIHLHQPNAFVLLRRDLRVTSSSSTYLLRDLVLFEHQTHESPQFGGIDDGQHKVENLKARVIQQRRVLPIGNDETLIWYAFSNFSF